MQSVVKSHLDAIPEDRKAIEKGGGNAVQKLHEVEKYIRKNKLKVSASQIVLLPRSKSGKSQSCQAESECKAQILQASNSRPTTVMCCSYMRLLKLCRHRQSPDDNPRLLPASFVVCSRQVSR